MNKVQFETLCILTSAAFILFILTTPAAYASVTACNVTDFSLQNINSPETPTLGLYGSVNLVITNRGVCPQLTFIDITGTSDDGSCTVGYSGDVKELYIPMTGHLFVPTSTSTLLNPPVGSLPGRNEYNIEPYISTPQPDMPYSCFNKSFSNFTLYAYNITNISDIDTALSLFNITKHLATPLQTYADICGDAVCESDAGENNANCHIDCLSQCGNNVCEIGENSINCPVDCRAFCGDNICNGNENSQTCSQDCGISGWIPNTRTKWSLTTNRTVMAIGSDFITNANPVDIKSNTDYLLKFKVYNPSGCTISVGLARECLSANGWHTTECVNDENMIRYTDNTVPTPVSWQAFTKTINIGRTGDASSEGYFRSFNFTIKVDCGANTQALTQFDDISLKEANNDNAFYSYVPQIDSTSGCCPSNYCWDGKTCVDSYRWMSSSKESPLWNRVLNNSFFDWRFGHVNSTSQYMAIGYRCVINNTGDAEWRLSKIKYDWNFYDSGYCNSDTDCYVGNSYSDATYPNYRCIKDGESVDYNTDTGAYSLGGGNHYCHAGEWTTNSYIIASALYNFTAGKNYILFCDDAKNVYNTNNTDYNILSAACSLTIKDTNDEEIVTGFILNDLGQNQTFLNAVISEYTGKYMQDGEQRTPLIHTDVGDCEYIGSEYLKCGAENTISGHELWIYYSNITHIFLLTDERPQNIDPTALTMIWDSIKNFFNRIFGIQPVQYQTLNVTTNFEKLYLLKNASFGSPGETGLHVTGVEENKYDEYNGTLLTFLYINYIGAENNRINLDYINKTHPVDFTYTGPADDKELRIKSTIGSSNNLWAYLTAMLRDR